MKRIILLLILIVICVNIFGDENSSNAFIDFFSPIPPPESVVKARENKQLPPVGADDLEKWSLRPIVTIPALRIIETTRENALIDVLLLTSSGGGISYQKLKYDVKSDRWHSQFSVSLLILLSGNLTAENPIDLGAGITVGFFNDLIMLGGGYDFGVVEDRNRLFGLLSFGINFNN